MQTNWVDFRAVKAGVSIAMVLERYEIAGLKGTGDSRRGPCPIHRGGGVSFTVNLTKNVFHCWSCKAKGNVLDLVAALEKVSIREAAQLIAQWFSVEPEQPAAARPTTSPPPALPENKPLTFTLKGIDHAHPYLAQREIGEGIARYFGAGVFSGKGSMSRRLVVPIHNEADELVAYAGRALRDVDEPRYKFPTGFHKSQVLFNLNRVLRAGDNNRVVLVEGFFDCFKVAQAGFLNVVALMGSSLSEAQETLLKPFREVVLMLDGDEPGRTATDQIGARLVRHAFVRAVDVPGQPDELSSDDLQALLGSF